MRRLSEDELKIFLYKFDESGMALTHHGHPLIFQGFYSFNENSKDAKVQYCSKCQKYFAFLGSGVFEVSEKELEEAD